MLKDRWFEIINDEIDDIPKHVVQLKSKYWQTTSLFLIVVIAGSAIMGIGKANGIIAVGCFCAITGILGILSQAIMCHTQLCLYRFIKEIRKLKRAKA